MKIYPASREKELNDNQLTEIHLENGTDHLSSSFSRLKNYTAAATYFQF